MTMLSFDYESVAALKWVAAGAGKTDPESFIIFEPHDDAYKVTTNTSTSRRSLLVKINDESDDEPQPAAIRAKAIKSVADKVDDESSLSISITEGSINLASGATTMKLTNPYEEVMDNTKFFSTLNIVTIEAYDVIEAASRAVSASSRGVIIMSSKDDDFTITSGDENVRTQEILPATINNDFELKIPATELKPFKELSKIEILDDLKIKQGTGLVEFTIHTLGDEFDVKEITLVIPTHVGSTGLSENPCDEDIINGFKVAKKVLSASIKYISGAVRGESLVTLDAQKGNNFITVKVEDDEGSAKTTIIDADIDSNISLTAPASLINTGLRSATGKEVIIGKISLEENDWLSITPVFKEDAEDESQNSDIVIAIACSEEE